MAKANLRYAPGIGTVIALYVVAMLATGSAGNSVQSAAEEAFANSAVPVPANVERHASVPGPIRLWRPPALRVPAVRPRPVHPRARPPVPIAPEPTAHHQVSDPEPTSRVPVTRPVSLDPGPFNGLLEPAGIGRRFWRSFSHVPPYSGPKSTPARYVVMLDPGHGGLDPGSIGPNGLQEKSLTLDIARRTALFLSEISEIEVRLTRDDDTGMTRHERVAKVRQSEADLIVSLHLNQLPQRDVTLTETFYAGPQNLRGAAASALVLASASHGTKRDGEQPGEFAFIADSARIAHLLQKSVFNEVNYDNPGAVDAGVKRRTLYVLSESVTPGVLVELTCLSNPREEARLATEAYRNRLAAAMADGIRAYFAQTDPLLVADTSL